MRKVYLYGKLGKEFGREFEFEINSVGEAIQALRANFPSFANAIRLNHYRVVVGETAKDGYALDVEEAAITKLDNRDLHIIPVVKGSKSGGLGKVLAGVAMLGLSAMTGGLAGAVMGTQFLGTTVGTMVGSIGTSMLLTGISTMLAPEQREAKENKSFTSTGPQNDTREGGIVPIAYGEVITGGAMINGVLSVRNSEMQMMDIILRDIFKK